MTGTTPSHAVYGGPADPQDRLLLNNGKGVFADASGRLPADTYSTFDADFVDVDKDGDLDIVTGNFPPGKPVTVLINDGVSFSDETSRFLSPSLAGAVVEVEAADYDRDERMDLYLATFINFRDMLLLGRIPTT